MSNGDRTWLGTLSIRVSHNRPADINSIFHVHEVTGSSSGFGRAVTEAALKAGDNVIATLRRPTDLDDLIASTANPERLFVLKCDVSISSDIHNAFSQGLAKFGTIDIVFNNAGYGICAEAESTPNDAARKMFDANFWGAADVSREAVRVFREVNGSEKGGWLFNVSSGAGIVASPLIPYYSARCGLFFLWENQYKTNTYTILCFQQQIWYVR